MSVLRDHALLSVAPYAYYSYKLRLDLRSATVMYIGAKDFNAPNHVVALTS